MSLQIGIVGLPNVGKSTLFNAMTRSKGAEASNYPFCTIDPNVGIVEVSDERLQKIASVVKPYPEKVVPAVVEFVDIAGLVKGAAGGEGLGNQFLAHIRECDAILQVVRVFEDTDVHHVDGDIHPQRDVETINTELVLADLQTLDKRLASLEKEAKSGDKNIKEKLELAKRVREWMDQGNLVIDMNLKQEEKEMIKDLFLLTTKPFLYAANMEEEKVANADVEELKKTLGLPSAAKVLPVSAKVEEELGELSPEEAQEFLESLGLKESGINSLVRESYDLLGLQTFFTAGPKEAKAWTIKKGFKAPQAAGVIHTDFEKGFIRAEICSWKEWVEYEGEAGLRGEGLLRSEGKEYEMQDGDVCHFLFNT